MLHFCFKISSFYWKFGILIVIFCFSYIIGLYLYLNKSLRITDVVLLKSVCCKSGQYIQLLFLIYCVATILLLGIYVSLSHSHISNIVRFRWFTSSTQFNNAITGAIVLASNNENFPQFGTFYLPFIHRWPIQNGPHSLRSQCFRQWIDVRNAIKLSTLHTVVDDWHVSIFFITLEPRPTDRSYFTVDFSWCEPFSEQYWWFRKHIRIVSNFPIFLGWKKCKHGRSIWFIN